MSGTIVQVELLTGRYHAHPWGQGQHAMAGPEWPPSPWRLLRALAAAWFESAPSRCSEVERDELLEALGRSGAPVLWLPAVSFGEIPLYQPIVGEKGPTRALHFDHFAILEETAGVAQFCVEFKVRLAPALSGVLASLLARLTYFGRAESRARLSLVDAVPRGLVPVSTTGPGMNGRSRPVLVSTTDFVAPSLSGDAGGHLVESLVRAGRARPLGTQWVEYAISPSLLRHEHPLRREAEVLKRRRVATVRVGLFRRIPITAEEAVPIARDFRDQAVDAHRRRTGADSLLLSGRDTDGAVACGHRHAFYLPQLDRGRIRSILIVFPDGEVGVSIAELEALYAPERLLRDHRYAILPIVEEVRDTGAVATPARTWRSATPFLAPLHDRRGEPRLEPAEQLAAALREVVGMAATIHPMSGPGGSGAVTPVRAHRYGAGGWRWCRRAGRWFDVEFSAPAVIPRPLGADAHFGLGQFCAVPADSEG